MRCLKRYVAREVYQILANPTADLVTGDQIRQLRTERGLSLTFVAEHLSSTGPPDIGVARCQAYA